MSRGSDDLKNMCALKFAIENISRLGTVLLVLGCLQSSWASDRSLNEAIGHDLRESTQEDVLSTPLKISGVLYAAIPTPPTVAVMTAALPDSARLKILAAIAQGNIAGAIQMWQVATGRDTVPRALQALQNAFSLTNRVAGTCAQVAKDIHGGFKFLNGNPQYLRISSTQGQFLSWQG